MDELGVIQDEYLMLLDADENTANKVPDAEKWYDEYDKKATRVIREARDYMSSILDEKRNWHIKLQKLEIPKFNSDPTKFYKWQSVFERLTKQCNDDLKYDYLLSCTEGEAHRYVENRTTYNEAMVKLVEKYGNVHTIVSLLIDDIKSLHLIRRGDFDAFEELSLKVNEFHDKLDLMGKREDAENSYVLREIESKFNTEDYQKWLESCGDHVDTRTVGGLVTWLDKQTHIRRITHTNTTKMTLNSKMIEETKYLQNSSMNNVGLRKSRENSEILKCIVCQLPHNLTECLKFAQLSLKDRWEQVKGSNLCFICLKGGHRRMQCIEAHCDVCTRAHHRLLHSYSKPPASNTGQLGSGSCLRSTNFAEDERKLDRCFLPAARVKLSNRGKEILATAILDSGSEINIITPRCCRKLNLQGEDVVMNIVGAGGVRNSIRTKMVEVILKDKHGGETVLECIVLDKACGQIYSADESIFDEHDKHLSREKEVYTEGGEVDILIGMTQPELHKQMSFLNMHSGLSLIETKLGYCLAGVVRNGSKGNYERGPCTVNSGVVCIVQSDNAEKLLEHLQSELAGIERPNFEKSEEEVEFESKMKLRRDDKADGRFCVSLPWKIDPSTLGNNRDQAVNRDVKLAKQLENRGLDTAFDAQIQEMLKTGILRKVDRNYPKRYLPLLAVINLKKESTKVRVCLDAKSKYRGTSLNDALYKGKLKMTDIMEIVTQFRCGKYAIIGDIRKMFWQILLDEYDKQYHGIIYKGETFVFTRVSFGGTCSPNIADGCMVIAADSERDVYPTGSEVLMKKRYVDDLIDASSSLSKIRKVRDETSELLGKFGFEIKEWQSNHSDVGKVEKDGRVLGLQWDGELDTLKVNIKMLNETRSFTRRMILTTIAEVWDPLGFLCGVTMVGKLILQSVVRMKIGWDAPVPDKELGEKWRNWLLELQKCEDLIVSRSLMPSKGFESTPNCELVGFSDGSSVAYGCALYLRWYNGDESIIDVKFVGAKGKLNHIKGTTVPRSEMCGAFLLSRLTHSAESALKNTELKSVSQGKTLFTDSSTVLAWIRSGAIKYKPYIKNKIIEVQELHPIESWKYVPGKENSAADLISKGCKHKDLEKIVRGPEMLYKKSQTLSEYPVEENKEEIDSEKNVNTSVNAVMPDEPIIDVNKFSSWKKLVRVTAYVLRFTSKCKKGLADDDDNVQLTAEEIRRAERYWIVEAQKQINAKSWKQAETLAPFKDDYGVIRIHGRLENMQIYDDNRKHPILLPKDHRISQLIVEEIHNNKCIHSGHLRVMAEVRKTYWILGIRQIAKRVGFRCVVCRRWRSCGIEQRMADLPSLRLCVGLPFENTAVDYFGPFETRYGGRARKKSYGAVFTCLTTRAVHVELVSDLTADRFLLALRRFVSIYGTPKNLKSDNGSNFVGAAREITRMLKSWRRNAGTTSPVLDFCESNLIEWSFSTPLASHHNGAVESMVKSVKTALNKVVNGRVLWEEDYRTIFAEITACINSRPLWPASDGDIDCPPITCEDMLRPTGLPRDPEELNVTCDPRKRYHQIQEIVNQWWRLWMLHFAPNLQCRSKWTKIRENVEAGDVVLLIDPEIPRSKWKMAIVKQVYPGSDGLVRSVQVKTNSGIYVRPITKLCLLVAKNELGDVK